jgi:hypothetical protein
MNKASILTSNKSDTCPLLSNGDNNNAYIKFNNCEMQRSGKLCPPTPDHMSKSEYPADAKIVMIPTVNIIQKNERYYEISCVMLRHYMESKPFSITGDWEPFFRHILPSRLRPIASPKGSQTDSAPTTLRYVTSARRWTKFKSIAILSDKHDRHKPLEMNYVARIY